MISDHLEKICNCGQKYNAIKLGMELIKLEHVAGMPHTLSRLSSKRMSQTIFEKKSHGFSCGSSGLVIGAQSEVLYVHKGGSYILGREKPRINLLQW